ncbi:MAG: Ig-like domain-containing protein, partial [Rubrobacter sp.]
ALLPGSPAVDAAANAGCPATDQRGVARRDGDGNGTVVCDIGAYERSDFKSPTVTSTAPAAGATRVRRGASITATFSEKMTRPTLTTSTFKLFKVNSNGSTTQITNATVSSTADGLKATLNPFGTSSTLLGANTTYRAIVTTGARDLAGNQLDQSPSVAGQQQKVWTFRTGST